MPEPTRGPSSTARNVQLHNNSDSIRFHNFIFNVKDAILWLLGAETERMQNNEAAE